MVKLIDYKKITTNHDIYANIRYNGTVSYFIVSLDGVINTMNNYEAFQEPKIFFEENFDIKTQEGHIQKYLNFRID